MSESVKKSKAFRGSETWINELQMQAKMYLHMSITCAIIQLTILSVWLYFSTDRYHLYILRKWFETILFSFLLPNSNFQLLQPDGEAWNTTYATAYPILKNWLKQNLFIPVSIKFLITSVVYLAIPFLINYFKKRDAEQVADKWLSGSKLLTEKEFVNQFSGEETDLPLSNTIKLPTHYETHHILSIGKTGSGKTITMNRTIERLKERENKAILVDVKGDYLSKFYNPECDYIFNIIDERSLKWNLFNEIKHPEEITAIAYSLIPDIKNVDGFWNNAAREVFKSILFNLWYSQNKTNRAIWDAISQECKDITEMLSTTPGGRGGWTFIQDGSGKQALSVHAVLMEYTSFFEIMPDTDNSFSISNWLRDDKPGFIFITNYQLLKDTLRPILSLFIDLASKRLLDMPESYNRRIFFLLDEFAQLQKLTSIVDLLTLSRSKGGSAWLAVQDIGAIEKKYEKEIRQTIINSCSTQLLYGVVDPDTQQFASNLIGDTKVSHVEETQSMGVEDNRDGISLSRKDKIEKLLLPADFTNLKQTYDKKLKSMECEFYLNLSGHHTTKTSITSKKYDNKNDAFVRRADFNFEEIFKREEIIREIRNAKEKAQADKKGTAKGDKGKDTLKQQLRNQLSQKQQEQTQQTQERVTGAEAEHDNF